MALTYRRYGISILIALLVSVYTLSNAGRFHIIDEVSLFAVTESLALRGAVDTNAIAWTQWVNSPGEVLGAFGPDGEVYSKKGPAPAFLAVPWYLFLHWIARLDIAIGLLQGTLLWNGLLTACTAGLLWLTANRLGYSDRTGAGLGLLFGLCTIAWPYAKQFFGEPLSTLSLLTCFYGLLAWRQTGKMQPWLWVAGLGAGVSIATVTAHALLVGIFGLFFLANVGFGRSAKTNSTPPLIRSPLQWLLTFVAFGLPIVIAAILLLWYNNVRFGNPLATGYHFDSGEGFTTPLGQGLWGLLISPYRGVFWHTPLFLLTLVTFPRFIRRHRSEGLVVLALSVALIGLYSTWWMWWGGFAWGPRFLVPLTPFWVLVLAPLLEPLQLNVAATSLRSLRLSGFASLLLAPLALLSFVVQLLAISVNYVNYETWLRTKFPTDFQDPLKFGPPAQQLSDWLYSPVLGQWQLLRENFKANTDLAWFWSTGHVAWLLVLIGVATLATLSIAFWRWWASRITDEDDLPSRPVRWLLPLLPLLLIAIWLGESAKDPLYGEPGHGYQAVLTDICRSAKATDAIITVAPYFYHIPMNKSGNLCGVNLPIFGYAASSLDHAEAKQVLNQVLQTHAQIWFVTQGLPVNDPDNTVERWLAGEAYKADDRWYDDYRLLRYATAAQLADTLVMQLDTPLHDGQGEQVLLKALRAPAQATAGDMLPVEIHYQLETPIKNDLHWFVQLLSEAGAAVALIDTAPQQGYTPFSTLPVGEDQIEKAGLPLAADLPPGQYHL
ncbi:MAG: hypothetical protein NT075_07525, partial [Chloroflexi bacterium]|nr:hypothetical protein [Chloroflexota bacterium]